MTPAQQAKYWRKYAKQNARMELYSRRIMLQAFKQCLDVIITSVEKNGAQNTLSTLDFIFPDPIIQKAYETIYFRVGTSQKNWSDQDVRDRFPRKKEERNAPKLPPLKPITEVQTTFGVGFFNPAWLARLRNIVTGSDVGQAVTSVTDTVKKQIRKSLEESVQQFVSPRKIVAKLSRDVGGLLSRHRAEVIARTEVTHIANIAAEQSALETGLKLKKVWIFTHDDRTRDTHKNVSRKPIDSTDKFLVGGVSMDKPGDSSAPLREIINCRCIVAYLPADDYEDLQL